MVTRTELITEIENRAKELVGIRFKHNILNAFPRYKSMKKADLEALKQMWLY
jgi:hypothetical protein